MGGFAIMLCGWAYYHCLMRQREKYDNLKKAFENDFPNSWGKKSIFPLDGPVPGIAKPKRKPQVRKPAVKKSAVKKPVAKKTTTKGIK